MSTTTDVHIARLLQLTDSACPVGTFAFSCGLESAAAIGLVHNADTLKEYARSNALQSAFCDGIAAIHAHRATMEDNYNGILEADAKLILAKMNDEARTMLTRMGKKLAELGTGISPTGFITQFLSDISSRRTHGTYPVVQGMLYASLGIDEKELFLAHQYGVINMVLSAALRCVRVSHIDTQKILFELMESAGTLYDEVKEYGIDEMHAFCPELDVMASIHEKGSQRMFMS